MKRMLALFLMLGLSATNASAAGTTLMHLKKPTKEQVTVLNRVLGTDFVKGDQGAMAPELLVQSVDLNHDGNKDLIALQKGVCSNHTCDFIILFNYKGSWEKVFDLEAWAQPYIESNANGTDNLISWERRDDDCMACRPPLPYRYKWSDKENSYVDAGLVKDKKVKAQYVD